MGPKTNFTCSDHNVTMIPNKCTSDCPSYIFDRTTFTETIQMTWDLVCDRKHLANLSQTIFMFGILVGNIVFGTLADKYAALPFACDFDCLIILNVIFTSLDTAGVDPWCLPSLSN